MAPLTHFSPTGPEHLLKTGTGLFWEEANRPPPPLRVEVVEGIFYISNYDTIWSVWKWKPVDFNNPAVLVFRTAVKISSEQRGEQSEVLMGALQDATEEQCVMLIWL